MATGIKTIDARATRDSRILDAETWLDSDGYWLPLARGYRCSLSDCHTIHEWNVRGVMDAIRNIEKCDCDDCVHTVHPKTLRAQQRFARRAKSPNDKENTMATTKAKAKTSKKRVTKKAATKKTAAAKPAASVGLNDSTGKYTPNADWNIEALPAKERVTPRDGSLRAQALAKMQKGGITVDSAIALCRAFDKKRSKPTNEDTVGRRGYELIRLVAISNGYGAKQKEDKITVA